MHKVYKGEWLSINQFRTEGGLLIHVCPYNYIYKLYKDKLPMHCYISIAQEIGVIVSVMEID